MAAALFLCALVVAKYTYSIVKWKSYVWLPNYVSSKFDKKEKADPKDTTHVMFVFVDHYEPGSGEKGVAVNREWLKEYALVAGRHKDSYGRRPQHTWFYPYDQHNDAVMSELSHTVKDGYGEIEFHWHHKHDTNETFRTKLAEALKWFNSFGAMISADNKVSFGFIHGNWSLDNSRGDRYCGVNRELDLLQQAGCYGDFTFPSFGFDSQPSLVNSIFYAVDDDQPKSYDRGIGSEVGKVKPSGLMIFSGPINMTTYGAVEKDPYPDAKAIDSWIDTGIHVKGRPEWVFVKVYTHGTQSSDRLYKHGVMDNMFQHLEARYRDGKYRLHYVTAREAFNIVKAAENGMKGDPGNYVDYQLPPPKNVASRK